MESPLERGGGYTDPRPEAMEYQCHERARAWGVRIQFIRKKIPCNPRSRERVLVYVRVDPSRIFDADSPAGTLIVSDPPRESSFIYR